MRILIIEIKLIGINNITDSSFMFSQCDSLISSNGYLPFIHTKYVCRWFEGTKRVKLGNVTTNVPCRYRSYLKRAYYDYYHLPPVEKRIPGHMCLKMKKGK